MTVVAIHSQDDCQSTDSGATSQMDSARHAGVAIESEINMIVRFVRRGSATMRRAITLAWRLLRSCDVIRPGNSLIYSASFGENQIMKNNPIIGRFTLRCDVRLVTYGAS
jgi:hypothetical protein